MRPDRVRAEVPEWVRDELDLLPPDVHSRLAARLGNTASSEATINEFAVLALLRRRGAQAGYEVDVDGRTPDVSVLCPGAPPVFVEVWTRSTHDSLERRAADWRDFALRVREIPAGFRLIVEAGPDAGLLPPSSAEAKHIAAHLRMDLMRLGTDVGTRIHAGGYGFVVAARTDSIRASLRLPSGGAITDTDALVRAVREKAAKYGDRVQRRGGLLIVVVAGASDVALST